MCLLERRIIYPTFNFTKLVSYSQIVMNVVQYNACTAGIRKLPGLVVSCSSGICWNTEVYVDAKDISDEEKVDNETKPISETEYEELLKEKGKQSLVPITMKSESQIAVQSKQFQYGVDYFVGDFVTVEHHRFGIRQNKIQLVGMIESFDRNGRNLTPTFKEE